MLCVKIKAGLGNQMFQYAFGRALSLIRNEPLLLDISHYQHQSAGDAKREFIIDNFNLKAAIAPDAIGQKYNSRWRLVLGKILRRLKKTDDYRFYPGLLKSRSSYYEGFWINEKYFADYADIIRKEFSLKQPFGPAAAKVDKAILAAKAAGTASVSLHIRRGDFVSNPNAAFNGVLGVPYYEKAIKVLTSTYVKQPIHIFVFSDDIAWAKEHLKFPYPIDFVSSPDIKDYEELILMSRCAHHIIANSTFSWWGAWLNSNRDKVVITTKQWLKARSTDELDMPKSWIRI